MVLGYKLVFFICSLYFDNIVRVPIWLSKLSNCQQNLQIISPTNNFVLVTYSRTGKHNLEKN